MLMWFQTGDCTDRASTLRRCCVSAFLLVECFRLYLGVFSLSGLCGRRFIPPLQVICLCVCVIYFVFVCVCVWGVHVVGRSNACICVSLSGRQTLTETGKLSLEFIILTRLASHWTPRLTYLLHLPPCKHWVPGMLFYVGIGDQVLLLCTPFAISQPCSIFFF